MHQIPLQVQLDDTATFDNFFVAENLQLVEKLNSLCRDDGEFLYCWGTSDSGKTHLAQALCRQFHESGLAAAYIPLKDKNLSPEILSGMNFMDLVCIDDIDQVEGCEQWETAIFDLYNELKQEGKHLVVFANKPPSSSDIKLADLRSRLTAMEIYRIESLDDEGKESLFITRAENRGLEVSNDVVKFITTRKSRSVSDLMDILDKLDHSSMALKRKVTIPLVKELFDL